MTTQNLATGYMPGQVTRGHCGEQAKIWVVYVTSDGRSRIHTNEVQVRGKYFWEVAEDYLAIAGPRVRENWIRIEIATLQKQVRRWNDPRIYIEGGQNLWALTRPLEDAAAGKRRAIPEYVDEAIEQLYGPGIPKHAKSVDADVDMATGPLP